MTAQALSGGFADPARDAARAFRAIMTAMARPGTIHTVDGAEAPAPLSPAAAVVLLTLCDADTGLWLAPGLCTRAVREWIAFHTGAPETAAADAVFALGPWADLPRADLPIGIPDYPDRSATLIVEVPDLAPNGPRLRGPGIETEARLTLPEGFAEGRGRFPLGHDAILTCGDRLAAVPRTTEVG